jgi:hypothetical protein
MKGAMSSCPLAALVEARHWAASVRQVRELAMAAGSAAWALNGREASVRSTWSADGPRGSGSELGLIRGVSDGSLERSSPGTGSHLVGVEPGVAAADEFQGRPRPHLVVLEGASADLAREPERHSGSVAGHRDLLPLRRELAGIVCHELYNFQLLYNLYRDIREVKQQDMAGMSASHRRGCGDASVTPTTRSEPRREEPNDAQWRAR